MSQTIRQVNRLASEVIASLRVGSERDWEEVSYALGVVRGDVSAYQSGLAREHFLLRGAAFLKKLKGPFSKAHGPAAYLELVKTYDAYKVLVDRQIQAEQALHDVNMDREELNTKTKHVDDIFNSRP
jgi:hypothetical protein